MILRFMQLLAAQAGPAIANHLWQSTLFAAAVALFTLAFRHAQARIRFALWLAASIKFFVPFALLIAVGNRLATPRMASAVQTPFSIVITQIGRPFSRMPMSAHAHTPATVTGLQSLAGGLALLWLAGTATVLLLWAMRWRRVSAQLRHSTPLTEGREVDALRRIERSHVVPNPVSILLSVDSMEPGVFGILRPVLLWPQGISDHLEDAHLEAILAHEAGHICRRDNVTAALHMLVEAVFWFHPLVWWLGTRLIAERERACDEAVLSRGSDPSVYAESILRACKFCLESPLPCVAGVSGSNLKRRIVRIMNKQMGNPINAAGKFLLGAAAAAFVVVPVAFGILHAPQLAAQEPQSSDSVKLMAAFEHLTIKPSTSTDTQSHIEIQPGLLIERNATLKSMIALAYGVQEYQISGAPDWADTDRFDIEARWKDAPGATAAVMGMPPPPPPPAPPLGSADMLVVKIPQPTPEDMASPHPVHMQLHELMREVLAKQFELKLTDTSKDMPVYDLAVADSGARLTPAASLEPGPTGVSKTMINVRVSASGGQVDFTMTHVSADVLAHMLAQQLHRAVMDKTGLKGEYDVDIHWPQGQDGAEAIAAALEDQVGLKLVPDQAPVAVLVVNQVEKPVGE
jgi:bla regulator protein BlaR1